VEEDCTFSLSVIRNADNYETIIRYAADLYRRNRAFGHVRDSGIYEMSGEVFKPEDMGGIK
jgi:hypothetical protein